MSTCVSARMSWFLHVLRMLVQVVSTFSRPVSCLFGQVCRHKNMCLFDISASSTNFHVSGMCASSRHVNIPAHNISFIASSMSKSSRNLLFLGHPVCVQIQLLTPLNPAMTWSCKGALEKHPLSCCYLEWEERVRKNTMAHIFQWWVTGTPRGPAAGFLASKCVLECPEFVFFHTYVVSLHPKKIFKWLSTIEVFCLPLLFEQIHEEFVEQFKKKFNTITNGYCFQYPKKLKQITVFSTP